MAKETLRAAGPAEISEVAAVILSANPHLGNRIQQFLASGGHWAHATPVVCEVDGCIQSCAVVFRRELWIGSERAALGGIGAVATLSEARGRGYATRLLQFCEDLLASEGYCLGVLFCTIVGFYKRLGWAPQEDDVVEFSLPAPRRLTSESIYQFRQIDSHLSSTALQSLYQEAASNCTGALVRSAQVWEEYRHWRREDADLFWIALAADRPVAYVRGRRTRKGILLQEATVLPEHHSALLPLLSRQTETVGPEGQTHFQANLSRHHPLSQLLEQSGIPTAWKKSSDQTSMIMVKPLVPASVTAESAGNLQRYLTVEDLSTGIPWEPRTWWGIDRF